MIKFSDFNKAINPDNNKIYLPMYNRRAKGTHKRKSYKEMIDIAKTDPEVEIGIFLPNDLTVIHIDNEDEIDTVLKIIKDRKEKVFVARMNDGIDIYTFGHGYASTENNVLAIGCNADITTKHKQGKVILPFKHPTLSKSKTLKNAKPLYYNGIGSIPKWLVPLYQRTRHAKTSNIRFPMSSRNIDKNLTKHFYRLNIGKADQEDKEELIDLLEDYVLEDPLPSKVRKKLIEDTDETYPESEFFDNNGKFYHNKMAEVIMEECNVKKDEKSNTLYHYNEKKNIYEHNPDYLKGKITRLAPTTRDAQKNEVIKFMEAYLEMDKVKFNKDPFILVFNNGVFDLATKKMYPHGPEHLETIRLNVDYNPSAYHKVVDEFFNNITCRQGDVRRLLLEAIGYAFLKTVQLSKTFILTGDGKNGKSTYLELINELVGDENATAIDPKSLGNNFRISKLYNRLVSIAGDISSSQMDDTDMLKSLASGDKIMIERKHQQAFEDKMFATMFFSANKLPRTPDTTYGFYRRFTIIPFNANLKKVSEVDGLQFKRDLFSKKAKEMVAYQATEAIARVFNTTKEFTEPKAVKDMLNEYRINNSSSLLWAYTIAKKGSSLTTKTITDLYSEYKIWCETDGYKSQGRSRFIDEIKNEFKFVVEENKNGDELFKEKS